MNKHIKQSGEEYSVALEFANKLPSGATLSSATATAIDLITKLTDTSILQSTTCTISGTQAIFKIIGGVHGHRYLIDVTAVLSSSDHLMESIELFIIDDARALIE